MNGRASEKGVLAPGRGKKNKKVNPAEQTKRPPLQGAGAIA